MKMGLVDPLKLATYGVKKPLAEKKSKSPDQREYPTDYRGQIDEWGAILKHREEVANIQNEKEKMDEQNKKIKYSQELMRNTGHKAKERQINRQMREEERRIVDMNVKQLEILEKEAKQRNIQMQKVLEKELLKSIKDK